MSQSLQSPDTSECETKVRGAEASVEQRALHPSCFLFLVVRQPPNVASDRSVRSHARSPERSFLFLVALHPWRPPQPFFYTLLTVLDLFGNCCSLRPARLLKAPEAAPCRGRAGGFGPCGHGADVALGDGSDPEARKL